MTKSLEDVSTFGHLFDKLYSGINKTKWSDDNLKKLASTNFINVFSNVEKVNLNIF